MKDLTIAELVRNNTLSAEMAALLWQAVSEKISFLTAALYQNAGKTTLSKAILDLHPLSIPLHYVAGSFDVTEKLLKVEKPGGYLVVREFSPADVPGYIWGPSVQKIFDTLKNGYSLQACIHAKNAEDAIFELARGNGINDVDMSAVKLVLYLEMFGTNIAKLKRRLVEIYEVHYVEKGKPVGHPLFKWHEENDTFEKISDPHLFARDKEILKKRKEIIDALSSFGQTSSEHVQRAVENFGKED